MNDPMTDPTPPAPTPSRGCTPKGCTIAALLAVPILITLYLLAVAIENWRGARAWKEAEVMLAEAGETADFAEIRDRWDEGMPPEADNFAAIPLLDSLVNFRRDPGPGILDGGPNLYADPDSRDRFRLLMIPYEGDRLEFSLDIAEGKPVGVLIGSGPPTEIPDGDRTWYFDADNQEFHRFVEGNWAPQANEFGLELADATEGKRTHFETCRLELYYREDFLVSLEGPAAPALLAAINRRAADPIAELRAAMDRPEARFQRHQPMVDFVDAISTSVPHCDEVRRAVQMLSLRASAALATGDTAQALESVDIAIRLAETVGADSFLVAVLIEMAAIRQISGPIWEGIGRPSLGRG